MRPWVLLLTGLSVPHAFCVDTETYLSEKFLGSLPEDLESLGRALKTILDANPGLHFGQERTQWDANHIQLFSEQYLPVLTNFVTLAVQHPQLLYSAPESENQPLSQVLDHLLSRRGWRDDILNVVPASPESTIPLMMAKADYMALSETYGKFDGAQTGRPEMCNSPSQWPIEASTFEAVVKIARGSWLITPLIGALNERDLGWEEGYYLEEMLNNIADIPVLTQRQEESIRGLSESLHCLQAAAEELAEAGCTSSWIETAYFLWSGALGKGTERLSQMWERQGLDPRQRTIIGKFVRTINLFRAKLAAGTILLRPAKLALRETRSTSLGAQRLGAVSAPFIHALNYLEQEIHPVDASASVVDRLALLGPTNVIVESSSVGAAFGSLLEGLPQGTKASDLGPDAMVILNEAYGHAKQIVGAYNELLDRERQELGEGSELDPFLVKLKWSSSSARLLGYAVRVMRRIEGVEGVVKAADLYDQDKCPLSSIMDTGRSQRRIKRAPQ